MLTGFVGQSSVERLSQGLLCISKVSALYKHSHVACMQSLFIVMYWCMLSQKTDFLDCFKYVFALRLYITRLTWIALTMCLP